MLRELQDNMKHNNIHIIGIPEGEEEEQGIENLFVKVMMENFPNLMREKVTQIQEWQSPKQEEPKEDQARHIIIKMANFQDKERILKTAREKQEVTYKGAPIRLAADFSMEMLQARGEGQKNIPSNENHKTATKTTLSNKALNKNGRRNKVFPRQKKSKSIHHQTICGRDAKGSALRKGRKRERGTQVQKNGNE